MGKEPKNPSTTDQQTSIIENALYTIKFMGVFYCLASLGCLGCGVMTLWFSRSNLVFPFNTASGLWTGVITFVVFVLGVRLVKMFSISNPEGAKCTVLWYYTFTIMNLTFSSLHVAYSTSGYVYCKNEQLTGQERYSFDEMPRLMLMEGFSIAFGMVIFLFSLFGTIYLSTRRRLVQLTGSSSAGSNEIGGCEVQGNCCV